MKNHSLPLQTHSPPALFPVFPSLLLPAFPIFCDAHKAYRNGSGLLPVCIPASPPPCSAPLRQAPCGRAAINTAATPSQMAAVLFVRSIKTLCFFVFLCFVVFICPPPYPGTGSLFSPAFVFTDAVLPEKVSCGYKISNFCACGRRNFIFAVI